MAIKNRKLSTEDRVAAKARPICQFSSWFKAAGIPVLPPRNDSMDDGERPTSWSEGIKKDDDLTILKADGDPFEVFIDTKPDATLRIKIDMASVPAKDLGDLGTMHGIFHQITELAGYGEPSIVDRGPAPTERLNYSDDFDLIVFRHCELRRVPNPSTNTLLFYRKTQLGAARHFLASNYQFCATVGLELDDLMTYAGIWTCNFHGQYELRADRSMACDNEKLLFRYLQQRFAELRKTLYKRMRSTTVDYDTAAVGLYNRPFTPTPDFEADSAQLSAESIMAINNEPVEEPAELEERVRRARAAARLQEALSRLPHDVMVERLAFAKDNDRIAPDARFEARRQLQHHVRGCLSCQASVVEGVKPVKPGFEALPIESDGALEEDEESATIDAE